jgi:hypothetical protein
MGVFGRDSSQLRQHNVVAKPPISYGWQAPLVPESAP